jgi:hypothetical protein
MTSLPPTRAEPQRCGWALGHFLVSILQMERANGIFPLRSNPAESWLAGRVLCKVRALQTMSQQGSQASWRKCHKSCLPPNLGPMAVSPLFFCTAWLEAQSCLPLMSFISSLGCLATIALPRPGPDHLGLGGGFPKSAIFTSTHSCLSVQSFMPPTTREASLANPTQGFFRSISRHFPWFPFWDLSC